MSRILQLITWNLVAAFVGGVLPAIAAVRAGVSLTRDPAGQSALAWLVLAGCTALGPVVRAFGGEIGQARALVHGKSSLITHDGRGVYAGLPGELEVGRYHSLAATRVPEGLEITARTDDGEVMGVRHVEHPVEGVQFHPESVLTPLGPRIVENFLS